MAHLAGGTGPLKRKQLGPAGQAPSLFQLDPLSALQMQNQSKGGGGAGGLCSSFNRPKDPGGLALFPNLKIFSGVWELPYGEAGRLEWGGALKLSSWLPMEDGGAGKEEEGLRVVWGQEWDPWGVRRSLCSRLSSASISPLWHLKRPLQKIRSMQMYLNIRPC